MTFYVHRTIALPTSRRLPGKLPPIPPSAASHANRAAIRGPRAYFRCPERKGNSHSPLGFTARPPFWSVASFSWRLFVCYRMLIESRRFWAGRIVFTPRNAASVNEQFFIRVLVIFITQPWTRERPTWIPTNAPSKRTAVDMEEWVGVKKIYCVNSLYV